MPPAVSKEATIRFGQAVDVARRAAGMSQAQLGSEIGRILDEPAIAQAQVSNWITGVNRPSPERVFAIEQALEVEPGSLSRHLGYVPTDVQPVMGVPGAIDADPKLTPMLRRTLKAAYAAAVGDEAAS